MSIKPFAHQESVYFEVDHEGKTAEASVTRATLTDLFAAEDTPAGWLAAFTKNQGAIEDAAQRALKLSYGEPVILEAEQFKS